MGQFFQQDTFTPEDHKEFRTRLHQQIGDLRDFMRGPGFSSGPASIGAELEMYLVDQAGQPKCVNQQLMGLMQHPQLTEELNRFNLEFNLSPVAAAGRPFSLMDQELRQLLNGLQAKADTIDTRVVPIGILPTLTHDHLTLDYMTDIPRYRALTNELSALRGAPFKVEINGKDSLITHCDEVTLEGANTSFQVHLKVPAERFKDLFNAAQLITPLVLAISGNSPLFLGQRLWNETRIALFKQSIDNRVKSLTQWRQPARVCFGHGWVRDSAWELFAENVALYSPILPFLSADRAPFAELCLHHGTVWPWNRAVLEPKGDGHLRIEYRALPAGPTVDDMMANAALSIGWTIAVADDINELIARLPFEFAEYNFYRAAQQGFNARLLWPESTQNQPRETPVVQIIERLLPLAEKGLARLALDSDEISRLLYIIQHRLERRQTGSTWQLHRYEKYLKGESSAVALSRMLDDYARNMTDGQPVSQWQ